MSLASRFFMILAAFAVAASATMPTIALAQSPAQKPNIILLVSDSRLLPFLGKLDVTNGRPRKPWAPVGIVKCLIC